jgi:hypothetical protein
MKNTFKFSSLAVLACLYVGSSTVAYAGDGHDHGAGHAHGDGHNHKDEKKHDHGKGHSDGDGHGHDKKMGDHDGHGDKHHDGKHETAADHAKHQPKAAHGGVVLEINDHHGELVFADGKIALYMSDHDGHEAPAKGFTATAMILSTQGRQGPIKLVDAGGNKLQSTKDVTAASGARVILTLKDPHGHMVQTRYQMK